MKLLYIITDLAVIVLVFSSLFYTITGILYKDWLGVLLGILSLLFANITMRIINK